MGRRRIRCYSSVVEHVLGKDEVEGSNPSNSSSGALCGIFETRQTNSVPSAPPHLTLLHG
jgi:hypothetical protein